MDDREIGLKKGLRQLTLEQLQTLKNYKGEMCLDEYLYQDGCWCPIAVAVGLDKWVKNPTSEKVYKILSTCEYDIFNTRGIIGTFYTKHRYRDLMKAVDDIIEEKSKANEFERFYCPEPTPKGYKPELKQHKQPKPVPNDTKPVWESVIEDMKERNEFGKRKYGTPLRMFDGRNTMQEILDELYDLIVYLKKKQLEEENEELHK